MEDRFGLGRSTGLEALEEFIAIEVVGDLARDEVHELAAVAQIVDDHDVVAAARR